MLDADDTGSAKGYPRGRWLIWGVLTLAFMIVYFHRVSPTFIIDRLMVDFEAREGAVLGSLAAIYFYVYVVMQIPTGLLADFWGPRYTITTGMVLAAAGSLAFGAAPTFFHLFLGRFLVGLGVSVVFVCILKALANWFPPTEFSTAAGGIIFMGNLGAIASTTPLALIVDAYGWRAAFAGVGLLSLAVALVCWRLVTDRPASPGAGSRKARRVTPTINKSMVLQVARNPGTWYPFWVLFGLYGTLMAFFGAWGGPYLMQIYGLSRTQAANVMLFVALGMMAGSLSGFLSDRLKMRQKPFLFFVALYVTGWSLLTFWGMARPPLAALYVLLFIMGAGGGGAAPVLGLTCVKEANPPEISGLAMGTANIGGFLGVSLMQPLMGYILDRNWEGVLLDGVKIYPQEAYFKAFLIGGLVLAATCWTIFLIRDNFSGTSSPQTTPKD